MEQCIALADYTAIKEDEISFRKGDIINVTLKGSASGYWEGFVLTPAASAKVSPEDGASSSKKSKKKDKRGARDGVSDGGPTEEEVVEPQRKAGMFPNCFVTSNMQPKRAPTFYDKALSLYSYKAKDPVELSFSKGDVITVLRPSTSPGWWCGINETAAVEMKERNESQKDIALRCGSQTAPLIVPSNFVTSNIVIAAYSFSSRQSHELPFEVGDVIIVHRRWNDGWWEGTLHGRRGIFPSNYTLPNVATTTPPFFCNRCKSTFSNSANAGGGASFGPGSGGGSAAAPDCKVCAKEEEITNAMAIALKDVDSGVMEKLDLFAYVDIDPSQGGKATLLSESDAKDKTVRRHGTKLATKS